MSNTLTKAENFDGRILGYTALGVDSATATYPTTTSWAVVDSTAKVSFVAPPSGNVEISMLCSIYASSRTLEFALSDNASFNEVA